jgi:hypothetical protein
MREVSKDEILREIREKEKSGDSVDTRLREAVSKSRALYRFNLDDRTSFLSLIWQESDGVRLLTPSGKPRTLADVGQRMMGNSLTFEKLANSLSLSTKEHNPEWFAPCRRIDIEFDFSRFGSVSVVPANDNERRQSPGGSFYIYDGVHRTIVLTKRLLSNEIEYRPVDILLLLPRPQD